VEEYASAKLKRIDNAALPFLYISIGSITRFTDSRDPNPRYREVFTFHRPETLYKWVRKDYSLRFRLAHDFPILDTDGLRNHFLVEGLFQPCKLKLVYFLHDRVI